MKNLMTAGEHLDRLYNLPSNFSGLLSSGLLSVGLFGRSYPTIGPDRLIAVPQEDQINPLSHDELNRAAENRLGSNESLAETADESRPGSPAPF